MPYRSLPGQAFWKFCRMSQNFASDLIYAPKFSITPKHRITTAGSCFAQNIGRYLRTSNASLLDAEPAPMGLSAKNQHRFGYGLYSGRYGNIYSAKQLAQLIAEVISQQARRDIIWQRGGGILMHYAQLWNPAACHRPKKWWHSDKIISPVCTDCSKQRIYSSTHLA